MTAHASSAYQNLEKIRSIVHIAKPDNFYGKNARSWLQSVENHFAAQRVKSKKRSKVWFGVSFTSGEELQWWETALGATDLHNCVF